MPTKSTTIPKIGPRLPTIWGMPSVDVHDQFWSSVDVEVVRPGQEREIAGTHQYYLLLDEQTLALFPVDRIRVKRGGYTRIRIQSPNSSECRDVVLQDASHRFLRFERVYQTAVARSTFGYVTRRKDIAERWRRAASSDMARQEMQSIARRRYQILTEGSFFDGSRPQEQSKFLETLIEVWNPSGSFVGIREVRPGVFASPSTKIPESARFFGRVWISGGKEISTDARILGPAVIWDDASQASPATEVVDVSRSARNRLTALHWPKTPPGTSFGRTVKRAFDICFSLFALLLTLPFYPFIMLAIFIEDGRPIFFGQRRETLGGREFLCWKFRSMCRGAERMRAQVSHGDVADGPQLFVPRDPRLTRVGLVMRALQVDEWPQFFNVLRGDMSVVGPRPLAFQENQWCPAWREVRLSVRAGITGMWQVLRTRRSGLDFQEWVKYDIQYVEQQSFRLDLRIIWESILLVLRGPIRRELIRVRRDRRPKQTESPQQAAQWNADVRLGEVGSELDS